jgi:DMSO/TMAO reductase YedYZ molybdopterin-dependent catalytic subunit
MVKAQTLAIQRLAMNRKTIILLVCISFFALFSCKDDKKVAAAYNDNNNSMDLVTTATPNGGKLKPAQEGPVRSIFGEPKIDVSSFTLTITGLVDSTITLSWKDLQTLPAAISDTMLMYCVEGWEVRGTWKGILLRQLLDKAHIQPEARYILFHGVDGYTTSLPIAYLLKYKGMLAYEVNGYPLKASDGFPLRLIAFGKFGYKWAKWVNKLEVTSQSKSGFWEGVGYSDQADVPIKRRSFYEGEDAKPLEY